MLNVFNKSVIYGIDGDCLRFGTIANSEHIGSSNHYRRLRSWSRGHCRSLSPVLHNGRFLHGI